MCIRDRLAGNDLAHLRYYRQGGCHQYAFCTGSRQRRCAWSGKPLLAAHSLHLPGVLPALSALRSSAGYHPSRAELGYQHALPYGLWACCGLVRSVYRKTNRLNAWLRLKNCIRKQPKTHALRIGLLFFCGFSPWSTIKFLFEKTRWCFTQNHPLCGCA